MRGEFDGNYPSDLEGADLDSLDCDFVNLRVSC